MIERNIACCGRSITGMKRRCVQNQSAGSDVGKSAGSANQCRNLRALSHRATTVQGKVAAIEHQRVWTQSSTIVVLNRASRNTRCTCIRIHLIQNQGSCS